MPNLKEVKNRISSVTSTQQITKAMKMVAAAKLRRAQEAIMQMRPYANKLNEILGNVSAATADDAGNPYGEEREVNRLLIFVVTSDKGLCGGFNTNIFRKMRVLLDKEYAELHAKGGIDIVPIGRKAMDHFKRREDVQLHTQFSTLFHHLNFEEAREAAEFGMEGFKAGTYDKVLVVFNEFKNVATQIVRAEQLLPLVAVEQETVAEENANTVDYIYEPNKQEIMLELIPKSIKIQLYKALLESNASEQGARMTAMDKATDNAGELLKELRLDYNRTRQAAITKEILEIVGGAEALSQN